MKKIFTVISILCIALSIGLILSGCGKESEKPDGGKLSNKEFLTSVGSWEREGDPSVKLNFNADGTGKMTADNGKTWHALNWIYDESDIDMLVAIAMVNSREVNIDCIAEFDKENTTLELTDLSTEVKVNYVKAGSQNITANEHKKDEELIGIWYNAYYEPDDYAFVARAFSLQKDSEILSGYGRFDMTSKTADIQLVYIDWYAENGKLKVILPSGVIIDYAYALNDEKLELFNNGNTITLEKVADGKIAENY